jgi:hypothetical protein
MNVSGIRPDGPRATLFNGNALTPTIIWLVYDNDTLATAIRT